MSSYTDDRWRVCRSSFKKFNPRPKNVVRRMLKQAIRRNMSPRPSNSFPCKQIGAECWQGSEEVWNRLLLRRQPGELMTETVGQMFLDARTPPASNSERHLKPQFLTMVRKYCPLRFVENRTGPLPSGSVVLCSAEFIDALSSLVRARFSGAKIIARYDCP